MLRVLCFSPAGNQTSCVSCGPEGTGGSAPRYSEPYWEAGNKMAWIYTKTLKMFKFKFRYYLSYVLTLLPCAVDSIDTKFSVYQKDKQYYPRAIESAPIASVYHLIMVHCVLWPSFSCRSLTYSFIVFIASWLAARNQESIQGHGGLACPWKCGHHCDTIQGMLS